MFGNISKKPVYTENNMQITIIAIGKNSSSWLEQGFQEYAKRFPKNWQLNLIEIPLIHRNTNANSNIAVMVEKEAEKIRGKINKKDFLIVLDERGKALSTEELTNGFLNWQGSHSGITFVIGGPDGVAKSLIEEANLLLSFGKMTLPHQLVRVMLAEQIYRVWTIINRHPYHRI
jgi:23S rRNA (pseudouridine1915-N3)-methyltransferase